MVSSIPSAGFPKFSLTDSRFDEKTYWGRLKRCLDVTDPRTLFVGEKKLQDSISLLTQFKNGTLPHGTTDQKLWEARKVKEAIIHPDTGKKIFMPFRMSGYVPFGTVTVLGMLLPAPSFPTVIFWQWMNQSHNAAVNYSNRNASKVSINVQELVMEVGIGNRFLFFFFTLATANICNVVLMRNHELFTGIEVKDRNGNVVGTSKIAAQKAVFETTLTRVFLPLPALVIPPLVMQFLERTKFLMKRPRLHFPVQVLVCVASFGFGLPLAIALFPQISKVSPSTLEPEIQKNTEETTLYYNKGL
ncbi:PREDICTED: sideroflexin-5-like [Acropora digitifera]|uniref:sideroflexin-5-like n=1 Tax=Acropora digitifera TaxID=70779 RepID=UPI00077A3254|nr:PREDICTED: sideroflexin-5-like [Acropora digitifera]